MLDGSRGCCGWRHGRKLAMAKLNIQDPFLSIFELKPAALVLHSFNLDHA